VAGGAFENLRPDRGVGPGVSDDVGPDGDETAFGVGTCSVTEGDRVALGVDSQGLFACQDDAHRALQEPRGEGGVPLNGEILLAAERAAVRDQLNLDLIAFKAEDGSDLELIVVHALTL
jgi:hypothetical protein